MQVDKNTILTTIYITTDEIMKSSLVIQSASKRPGPDPNLSDAEIVTLAIYQELIGEPREDHFFRLHSSGLKQYFPDLNERSRYNRRKKDLWSIILAVRTSLTILLNTSDYKVAIIDSAPVPVTSYKRDKKYSKFYDAGYGYCNSKAMKYYGYKFHNLTSLTGIILDFVLTPANHHDNQVVEEFLEKHKTRLQHVLGDKGYNDAKLEQILKEQFYLQLWSPRKRNQKRIESKQSVKSKNCLRLMVETINAQLQEQFHLSKHYAKSQLGFFARTAAKVTAHTFGIFINTLFDRPRLALASLAV